jgi:hypothetical protein
MSAGTRSLRKTAPVRLAKGAAKPVKSNPGSGTGQEDGNRNGASSSGGTIVTCPCCNGQVRVKGANGSRPRLEIVKLTKPERPWRPAVPPGSPVLARKAIEAICKANGITVADLWPQNHDPGLGAIRKRAAQAARETGAAASTIGSILRRNESTINKLAPKWEVRP